MRKVLPCSFSVKPCFYPKEVSYGTVGPVTQDHDIGPAHHQKALFLRGAPVLPGEGRHRGAADGDEPGPHLRRPHAGHLPDPHLERDAPGFDPSQRLPHLPVAAGGGARPAGGLSPAAPGGGRHRRPLRPPGGGAGAAGPGDGAAAVGVFHPLVGGLLPHRRQRPFLLGYPQRLHPLPRHRPDL